MFKTSDTTAKLDEALAKAQGEFTNPEKNRTVKVRTKPKGGSDQWGEYSFDYATFDAIVAMARPILHKHGIAVSQFPGTARDGNGNTLVSVTTRVSHAGEWMLNEISGPCEGDDMQKIGSGLTYLERYSYAAMLGIVSEYDDDGNAAVGNHAEPSERARPELPACPACNKTASVIIGKPEYGGGYVCFAKKGGCGNKWQAPTDADKAAADETERLLAGGELTTGDKVPPPKRGKSTFDTATEKIPQADTVAKIDKFVTWIEAKKIDQQIDMKQLESLSVAAAERAIEVCETLDDYADADRILRLLIAKMRIPDADGTALRIKLADAKDAKLGAAA